jgi:NhaP-type Na+/H+ or K+/H+ antiporter
MSFEAWYVTLGVLLVLMTIVDARLKVLPITTTILYLILGAVLGPRFVGAIQIDPVDSGAVLERVAEFAVIVSLFTAGLKISIPLRDARWRAPVCLAFFSMTITVALVAGAGVWLLGLPLGAAILLGAVLAPTDPVLASEVQLANARDRDQLRFNITAEAGLNDGTAFPFVMLGLGLLGLHEIGEWGWRWLAVDVVWAISGGLACGALFGALIGRGIIWLRHHRKEAFGRDESLTLGVIALSYGAALFIHTYGFLAVFAAGLAMSWMDRRYSPRKPPEEERDAAKEAELKGESPRGPTYLTAAVLGFNEQLERLLEVGLVLLVGAMLTQAYLSREALWFAPLLFLLIRPIAVWIGLARVRSQRLERPLAAWFGIRGIGSIYYLAYANERGLPHGLAEQLTAIVLTVIAASITIHGLSVSPIMSLYERRRKK